MYPEAAAEFERALSIRRKAVAQTLNNLANAVRGHGDVVRAEQLLLEGLALQEQLRGPGDIEVAKLSTNLASLYDQRGDFARAEPMYQRALKIVQTRNLRSDDSFLAVLLTNLGLLYQNRGDLDAARPLLEQALQLRETLLSGQPDHPQIATAAINLASNYQESGKLEAAESLVQTRVRHFREAVRARHAPGLNPVRESCDGASASRRIRPCRAAVSERSLAMRKSCSEQRIRTPAPRKNALRCSTRSWGAERTLSPRSAVRPRSWSTTWR